MEGRVKLGEGAGGEMMQELLKKRVLPLLGNRSGDPFGIPPDLLDDSTAWDDTAFTIDGHTVWPLIFPGGDIGSLAVTGTVNDLAVVGAVPERIALSMVIEEGLSYDELDRILSSVGEVSRKCGVEVVTGDTKVVESGGVKGMFISTAGIGTRHPSLDRCLAGDDMGRMGPGCRWLRDDRLKVGDRIILTGSVGDHGISLLSFREGYGFETEVASDLAPLTGLMDAAISAGGVYAAKDLTRGGLSNGVNELSQKSRTGILLHEEAIPVKEPVRSACDMLGLDPYEIGNEGKAVLAVSRKRVDEVISAVRSVDEGKDAVVIGEVTDRYERVVLETAVGGRRIMDPPYGDPIPRIC